jgi:hypothetical protein
VTCSAISPGYNQVRECFLNALYSLFPPLCTKWLSAAFVMQTVALKQRNPEFTLHDWIIKLRAISRPVNGQKQNYLNNCYEPDPCVETFTLEEILRRPEAPQHLMDPQHIEVYFTGNLA